MKFLADENFPRLALERLREAGFDVTWISESHAEASDERVLELAADGGRTLLTFDKDFGDLAFRFGVLAESGVILFRLVPQDPIQATDIALKTLRSGLSWAGHFAVVREDRIRLTRLPLRGH